MIKILSLGIETENENVDVENGISNNSAFNYDLVIVDTYRTMHVRCDMPWNYEKFPEDELFSYEKDVERFKREIAILLENGGTVVCIIRPVCGMSCDYFNSRKGHTTAYLSNYDWLPFKQNNIFSFKNMLVQGSGNKAIVTTQTEFSPYLKMNEIYWEAYFEKIDDIRLDKEYFDLYKDLQNIPKENLKILAVNKAKKPISIQLSIGKGTVIFLPPLNDERFSEILLNNAIRSLKKGEKNPSPKWIKDFTVPDEAKISSSIAENEKKIKKLTSEKDILKEKLEKISFIKELLYEHGTPLEESVRSAFEEIGFTMKRKGDKDWIAIYGKEEAVIEVTGQKESIDIQKFRQLLHYLVDETTDKKERKAILVANHFFDMYPSKRGAPFTEKTINAAEPLSICLLTTTELFSAIIKMREGKIDSKTIRKTLLSANGICKLS
ncbi:MAG: hypothetical protein WAN47_03130 [Nitrosotalea sp.]